jgi:hypothetical protein
MSIEEEEVQLKGIENIFNKIIEMFPYHEEEVVIQVWEAFRTLNIQDQKQT